MGGDGGRSGAGGLGGEGTQWGGDGGDGGTGGAGGRGGHGGGGGGGPSVGVLLAGDAEPVIEDVVFDLGEPGPGGASAGDRGLDGVRAEVHALP